VNRIPRALRPNRFTSPRWRFALAAVAVGGLSLLMASTASADFFTPESGGSPNADKIDTLYKLILGVAVVVFVGVEGALFYCLWKFKAKKGAVAAQIHGNTRLEIGWTIGAAVILVVLAAFTFAALPGIRNPPNTGPNGFQSADGVLTAGVTKRLPPNGKSLNIEVNGQQYVWRFVYPDGTPNTALDNPFSYEELVVPVDTAITLDIRAQDVAHSWWIPKLGGKFDAIPGYTNHTWFKIPAKLAGQTFTGQCAELCGRNHANMTARVKAVTADQYEKFLAAQRKETQAGDKAAAVSRKEFEDSLSTDQAPTP
jgi:cytochrome c oxidase subunit 2